MKYITKLKDAIAFFEDERVINNNNILSDGNGLFPKKIFTVLFCKKN